MRPRLIVDARFMVLLLARRAPIKAAQSKADYGGTVSVGDSQVSITAGALYVVATPIGNLDDMSPRAVAVLRGVAVLAAEDTRHSAGLLRHFDIATPLVAQRCRAATRRAGGAGARRGGARAAGAERRYTTDSARAADGAPAQSGGC